MHAASSVRVRSLHYIAKVIANNGASPLSGNAKGAKFLFSFLVSEAENTEKVSYLQGRERLTRGISKVESYAHKTGLCLGLAQKYMCFE
jgi:hypothetical protein